MTNREFAETFPPRLYEAFPELALFNPFCRDITLEQIKVCGLFEPEKPIPAILDYLCTEGGVIYVAGAIFAALNDQPFFGTA